MSKQQFLTASQLVETIKVSDQALEFLANEYRQSAKIRMRMTFDEFMLTPYRFIEASKDWATCIWAVDFVNEGAHQKMWVNDQSTNKTLRLELIRKGQDNAVINCIKKVTEQYGKPEQMLIDADHLQLSRQTYLVAWCYENNVAWDYSSSRNSQHKEVA
jgi:hypothetical protein